MKRLIKWFAIAAGTLIVLIILFVGSFIAWLKWSGEHEWKQAQAELRARGEKLTFAELVPPPPPDSDNFFADPLWAEYADLVRKKNEQGIQTWEPRLPSEKRQLQQWQYTPLTPEETDRFHALIPTEKAPRDRIDAFGSIMMQLRQEKDLQKQKEEASLLLDILAPAQPVLTRIAKLSERPKAQFRNRYDLGAASALAQTTATLKLLQILDRKVFSELLLGKNSDAATDTLTLLRLSFTQKSDPLLISYLVGASSVSIALKAVNEGIVRHSWTESDLTSFQEMLGRINLQEGCLNSLRGERAYFNQFDTANLASEIGDNYKPSSLLERVELKLYPLYVNSIIVKDKAYHNLWVQRYIDFLNSHIPSGWNDAATQSLGQEIQALTNNPIKRLIYIFNVQAAFVLPLSIHKAAETQNQVNQTLIACALERYRLAHGSYPTTLDALVPDCIAKLPNSSINGKPMNYSLQPDGTFSLWSVGWNLKTLNGKPGEFVGDGDIVWNQPLASKARPTKEAISY